MIVNKLTQKMLAGKPLTLAELKLLKEQRKQHLETTLKEKK